MTASMTRAGTGEVSARNLGYLDQHLGKYISDGKLAGTLVVVYRHGTLQFPVEIALGFEDGSKQLRHWDGSGLTFNVDNVGPSQLVSVNVDPEQRILLDDDRSNNWLSIRSSSAPRCRERALYAAQLLLGAFGP